jgi:hypothetical protein
MVKMKKQIENGTILMPNQIIEIEKLITNKTIEVNLIKFLCSQELEWRFLSSINYSKGGPLANIINDPLIKESEGFAHTFYEDLNNGTILKSKYYEEISGIVPYLKKYSNQDFKLLRLRAVYMPLRSDLKGFYNLPHVDLGVPHKTIIYYCNTNDGETIIFNETFEDILDFSKKTILARIKPQKGKAVLFNGLHYHTGSFSSDDHRLLLNCNFL